MFQQYYFFTSLVDDLNSTFVNAYTKTNDLKNYLTEISNNKSVTEETVKIDKLREKLTKSIDVMLSHKINNSNPSYRRFNDGNTKLVMSTVYLTRVVTIINKLLTNMDSVSLEDIVPDVSKDEIRTIEGDISALQRIFKKRPTEGIAVFFDAITNNIWQEEQNHNLLTAFQTTCDSLNNNETTKNILTENSKVRAQICAMKYGLILSKFGSNLENDFENAKTSLITMVNVLRKDDGNINNIHEFLKSR